MLPGGLILCLDRALPADFSRDTPGRRRYARLVAGLLREDVIPLPLLRRAVPSPSLRHIWPRSQKYFTRLYERARTESLRGDAHRSDLWLGRALHVLIDMACPAHALGAGHYLHDPFERYVEAHLAELKGLPVPEFESGGGPSRLIKSLAREAQRERAVHTYPFPRLQRRLRRDTPLSREEIAAQAERLIPLAGAHVRAALVLFDEK